MIVGIGTDIVSVARMASCLKRFGPRFAWRILADEEQREFAEAPHQDRFLAKRFAAKEAVAKALGTGFRNGLRLRDVRVAHNELGQPELRFTPQATETLQRQGIARCFVSISDEHDYATAFVVLERLS
jgi:holo-[acyl-carrier protein] synthase